MAALKPVTSTRDALVSATCFARLVSAIVTWRLRKSLSKSKYSVTSPGRRPSPMTAPVRAAPESAAAPRCRPPRAASFARRRQLPHHADLHRLERNAAAHAALPDRAFDQRLVAELRRIEVVGHAALLAQVVQLALGTRPASTAASSCRARSDRRRTGGASGDDWIPVAHAMRRRHRSEHRQHGERPLRTAGARHSTPRKLIRSCFSWPVSRMSKRRS